MSQGDSIVHAPPPIEPATHLRFALSEARDDLAHSLNKARPLHVSEFSLEHIMFRQEAPQLVRITFGVRPSVGKEIKELDDVPIRNYLKTFNRLYQSRLQAN